MGRAARWLKALFSGSSGRRKDSTHDPTPEKKKGWSFSVRKGSSYREKTKANVVVEEEEGRRAIAVAEATAAVAEAAVAAAEAAAAVVRLTSRGRTCVGRHERRSDVWAAVKIQSAFRGYLARRALKALKGLVKIQALVRGYIVRKQAAEALRCMQALVRAQARVRASRVLQDAQPPDKTSGWRHCHDPPKQENKEHSNCANSTKTERPRTLKRNGLRVKKHGSVKERATQSPDWKWLDRWMDERCCDYQDDDKEKILEVDAGGPQINPKWRNRHHSMCFSNQNSHNLAAMPESPSDSTTAQRSVLSSSSVEMQQHSSSPLGFPREGDSFYSTCSRLGGGGTKSGPFTPSKSECSWSYLSGFSEYPSYMSNTESSRAKARSLSAPRQRLEYENFGSIKGDQVHGYGTVSQPFSSSRRASSLQLKFAEKAYPGSGRLDRMGVPTKI